MAAFVTRLVRALICVRQIKRSGIFCEAQYRSTYLNDRPTLKLFPLLHYVFVGERLGYKPNPFFDPFYFRKASGGADLCDYLSRKRFWALPTSSHIDLSFIYPSDQSKDCAPLLHYWRTDSFCSVPPNGNVDLGFIIKAYYSETLNEKDSIIDFFWHHDCRVSSLEEMDLKRHQYRRSIEMTIMKTIPSSKSADLLFVQCTRKLDIHLIAPSDKYDLLLNYYDCAENEDDDYGHHRHADYIFCQKGTKMTAISNILDHDDSVLLRYDHVMFLDDDVVIDRQGVETVFSLMARLNIDLAQPSLSSRSSTWYNALKQPAAGQNLKWVSAVEIMMPAVSNRLLSNSGWVFRESISGWGADFLLSAECYERFCTRPALIGSVVAEHLREVDQENGAFYTYLKMNGFDASLEAKCIELKHGVESACQISEVNQR